MRQTNIRVAVGLDGGADFEASTLLGRRDDDVALLFARALGGRIV
jgi:hypothetical protein